MENKTFLVINSVVNPENMQDFQEYLQKVMPIFGQHGGKSVSMFKTVEQIMGENGPMNIGIIEFPDAEVIKTVFANDEFNALADLRGKAFKRLDAMICASLT